MRDVKRRTTVVSHRLDDSGTVETRDHVLRSLTRHIQCPRQTWSCHERVRDQRFGSVHGLSTRTGLPQPSPKLLTQLQERIRRVDCTACLQRNASDEERDPALELTTFANAL